MAIFRSSSKTTTRNPIIQKKNKKSHCWYSRDLAKGPKKKKHEKKLLIEWTVLQWSGDSAARQQSQTSRRTTLFRPLGPLDVRWRCSRRRVVRMFNRNFASSPDQLALFLMYVTMWHRSDARLSVLLSREYFCADRSSSLRCGCDRSVKIKSLETTKIKKVRNFGGLVLFCIEADFYVQIRILQHFSRSTRFKNLCTAPNSKIRKILTIFFQ